MSQKMSGFLKGQRSPGQKKVQTFKKKSKGLGKKELRKLESALLKPSAMPHYNGPKPRKGLLEERTIMVIFGSNAEVELFKKHIKTNYGGGFNTNQTGVIIALLKAIENEELFYDKHNQKLVVEKPRRLKRGVRNGSKR